MLSKGRAFGSLVTGGMPNPLRLRAQYDLYASPVRRLGFARDILTAKLTAMCRKVQRRSGRSCDAARSLTSLQSSMANATSVEQLLGFEGAATRAYYAAVATWIQSEGFAFQGRSHRPPKDPVNSLLSFIYSVIFGEMQTALLAHGLDPYPGVLHELHRNHPALASDLIEPYRSAVADPFVLMLVNRGDVRPDGFETRKNGGVYMNAETRHLVIDRWERYIRAGEDPLRRPIALLEGAVAAMLAVVLGESERLVLPLGPEDVQDPEALREDLVDRDDL